MTEASKLRPRRDDEPDPEQPEGQDPAAVDLRKGEPSATPQPADASPDDTDRSEGPEAPEDPAAPAAADAPVEDDDELADAEDRAYSKELRKGLLVGVGAGVIGGLIVSLVLGAFVWPGWFVGAGSPGDVTDRAVAAFSARDVNALNAVTCLGSDGNPTSQIPPDALSQVAGATADGPPVLSVDTQALAPITLTLSAQGQTQSLPSNLVLGQNDHSWCVVGLSRRQ